MNELKRKLNETERGLRASGRNLHRLGLLCYEKRRYVAAQKLFIFRDQIIDIAEKLRIAGGNRKR